MNPSQPPTRECPECRHRVPIENGKLITHRLKGRPMHPNAADLCEGSGMPLAAALRWEWAAKRSVRLKEVQ